MTLSHVPVLPQQTLAGLDPQPGEIWIDATAGLGGHARMIAERVGSTGLLIALDQDPGMLVRAKAHLAGLPVRCFHANFDQFEAVLMELKIDRVNGLLADLGVCSAQLDDPGRGLSFAQDGPLDMRLDPTAPETAADFVNQRDEAELADVFWKYGEERHSRRVARRMIERREERPFDTTHDLAKLVRQCVPRSPGLKIDPATRVFQALRIAVNDELSALENLLRALPGRVAANGRVGIISFHSLEDRLVKRALTDKAVWEVRTKKPLEADEEEARQNPRSRSAKLRIARRLDASAK
jgi:16S rRNA (cytosine1402-N4)-methyltransferase